MAEESESSSEYDQQKLATGSNTEDLAKVENKTLPNESQAGQYRRVAVLEHIDQRCLLLADTTMDYAPVHFRQLLLHYDTKELSQAELLILLIYTVALESGFVTRTEYANIQDLTKIQAISSFHAKNVLKIARERPTYTHAADKNYYSIHLCNIVKANVEQPNSMYSLLTALVSGDFMICTLTPDRSLNIRGDSICLSIGRYVLGSQPKNKPVQCRFRKLDELSSQLRDKIFVPVRNRQLELIDDIAVYPSLVALPIELYDMIFQYLSQNQLEIMANTCKRMNFLSTTCKYYKKIIKCPLTFFNGNVAMFGSNMFTN